MGVIFVIRKKLSFFIKYILSFYMSVENKSPALFLILITIQSHIGLGRYIWFDG